MSIRYSEPLFGCMSEKEAFQKYVSFLDCEGKKQLEKKVRSIAVEDGVVIARWDQEWGKYHLFDKIERLARALLEKQKGNLFQKIYSSLSSEGQLQLERRVRSIAVEDGASIADCDQEWGKYHLFDKIGRLARALLEEKKNNLFPCADAKVSLIVNRYPLVQEGLLSDRESFELIQKTDLITELLEDGYQNNTVKIILDRLLTKKPITFSYSDPAVLIAKLNAFKQELSAKYPELFSTPRGNAWRAIETCYLTLPAFVDDQEWERLKSFASVIEELLIGTYNPVTAEIILDRLLASERLRPASEDLSTHLRLKSIRYMASEQIREDSLHRANESVFKSVNVIPSCENKQGKFKPLDVHGAQKEVYAYEVDRALGFGMTAPTELLNFRGFVQSMNEMRDLLSAADKQLNLGNSDRAEALRKQAFTLFNNPLIPQEIRNRIFGEIYVLCGNNQQDDGLGESLFYNANGYSTSDLEKSKAIQSCLNSEIFKNHLSKCDVQGSIQQWIHGCERAYDLIMKDPTGGEKLKTAPKALVHLYALLGIIKGSMDCSVGNTFVDYDAELGRVVNFWDFDDEKSMPTTNHFQNMRLWQMGLPQCAQPFEKAVLLMFSNPALLKKLIRQQTSLRITKEAYDAQTARLKQIISLFKKELSKDEITLTPRELFFKMFDGKKEYNSIKNQFSVSAIEIFEGHLANQGLGRGFPISEESHALMKKNIRSLYLH